MRIVPGAGHRTDPVVVWTLGCLLIAGLLAAAGAQLRSGPAVPVRLDPANPHYFLFRGRTIALVTSGEHYGAVINSAIDYDRYLATLQSDGLNYARIFAGTYVEDAGRSFGILRNDLAPESGDFVAPWARSDSAGYAGGGNKFDLDRWNPAYFRRLRDFLADASRRGIVVEITLFSSQYGEAQWKLSPFNAASNVNGITLSDWKKVNTVENGRLLHDQESYVRKVVRAVRSFDNIFFEIENEPWSDRPAPAGGLDRRRLPSGRDRFPPSTQIADSPSLAWQAEVARWIESEEATLPKKHLIAQCYANAGVPVRTLVPGVSIVNFHYAIPEAVTWNYGLGKAIADDETGFSGRGDAAYRRQAWDFMLAGGSTFDNLDYSFNAGHEDGRDTAPNGPAGGSPALRRQLRILTRFLQALPLEEMRPDGKTVLRRSGVLSYMLSWPGHVYAMYLDGRGPVTMLLALPAGHYRGQWTSTTTGAIVGTADFRSGGRTVMMPSPQFLDGVALRIDRAAP